MFVAALAVLAIGQDVYAGRASTASTASEPAVSVTVDILPGYRYQDDAAGTYYDFIADRTRRSMLNEGTGSLVYSFSFWRSSAYPDPIVRYETLVLDAPVPGGGASQTHVLQSRLVTNHLVLARPLSSQYASMTAMPVGASALTNAQLNMDYYGSVEGNVKIASLVFGAGVNDTKLSGSGTSKVKVTRTSDTQWIVEIAPGSIGRLYTPNGVKKVNAGLYYFDGVLVLNVQP
ncbi:MAG TPA: hypothetical protein VFV50_16320 [Bdellovibrionales bacterium]|nr:hypothetical protein [Bdellovibrionales bacterium]